MTGMAVDAKSVRPFSAAVILETPDLDPAIALERLGKRIREMAVNLRGGKSEIVASGITNDSSPEVGAELVGIDAIVVRKTRTPRWWIPQGEYSDVDHDLVVWAHRGPLFAVVCNGV